MQGGARVVTMSETWDRTTAAMADRRRQLTPVVLGFFTLPAILPALVTAVAGRSIGLVAGATVVVVLLALVGQLAVTAIGSNGSVTAGEALRIALARLPLTIGLFLLAYLALIVLFVPIGAMFGLSGAALTGFRPGAAGQAITPGTALTAGAALLVVMVVFVFLFVRAFFLLSAVVVNERIGIRSFARSWELTRGLFWRILGVVLVFFIVFAIASFAVQAVAALVARLALGGANPAGVQLVAAIVGSVVTSLYYTVISVFGAQLYAARSQLGVADVFA